jgi:hypothetical protein
MALSLLLLSCLLCTPAALVATLIVWRRKRRPPPTDQPRRAFLTEGLAGLALAIFGIALFIGYHLLDSTGFVEENVASAISWGAFLGAPLGGVGAWMWGESHYGWSRNPVLGLFGAAVAAVLGMIAGHLGLAGVVAALGGSDAKPLLVLATLVLVPVPTAAAAVGGYQLMRGGTARLPPILR